ncbi:MAG: hypothetical protein IJD75_05790 [Clostridia bacterium]|nr:hypothetical protein [Clostridia bacterium]
MKRLLCAILTLVCILSFCSCDLLNKFISTAPNADPTTTTPSTNKTTTPENKTEGGVPDETTPPKEPEATTPEKAPDETKPENPPEGNTITVQIIYQTGGVHRVESFITTTEPATLLEVYNLFANEHPYEMFNNVDCYLNDKPIDPTQTVYMQNGDKVYLQENGDGYHLHIWEPNMGYCRSCSEECSHEWEGNQCRICKSECYHDGYWNNGTWIDGHCGQCGTVCEHREWDDNRQCLVCGAFLGVDLLQIEIYENGEFMYSANGSIETTVENLLMAYYGYYPWNYLESNYEFYFNGVRVDGSYWITEHGILELVTRTYE